MKVFIHCFSATGNTARAARMVADRLAAAGREVAFHAIDGRAASPAEIPDLTIMAFPIWSWAAPHFALDHARRLPKAKGARAAVLATCGAFGGQAVGEMARALRGRGYEVVCSGELAYPDNWVLAVNPPTGEDLAAELAAGDEAARKFADNLLSDRPPILHCAFIHVLWSWPIAMLFRFFGRRFMGKFFAADDACTSCGLCAAACPAQAIRMEGAPARPRWNASCAGCYRCINLCPATAIQISALRLVLHLGLNLGLSILCLGSIGWIRRSMAPLPGFASWGLAATAALAAYAAATMVQLTAADAGIRWLAARPALRPMFLRSHTKSFGRYRAPGFRILHGQTNEVLCENKE